MDRHPEMRNVWLFGGGNAEGFKFGPVLGEYMAQQALGEDPYPEYADRFRITEETFESAGPGRGKGAAGPRRSPGGPAAPRGRNHRTRGQYTLRRSLTWTSGRASARADVRWTRRR